MQSTDCCLPDAHGGWMYACTQCKLWASLLTACEALCWASGCQADRALSLCTPPDETGPRPFMHNYEMQHRVLLVSRPEKYPLVLGPSSAEGRTSASLYHMKSSMVVSTPDPASCTEWTLLRGATSHSSPSPWKLKPCCTPSSELPILYTAGAAREASSLFHHTFV